MMVVEVRSAIAIVGVVAARLFVVVNIILCAHEQMEIMFQKRIQSLEDQLGYVLFVCIPYVCVCV